MDTRFDKPGLEVNGKLCLSYTVYRLRKLPLQSTLCRKVSPNGIVVGALKITIFIVDAQGNVCYCGTVAIPNRLAYGTFFFIILFIVT